MKKHLYSPVKSRLFQLLQNKQESPPAWTQEAYRPLCSKSARSWVPTLDGGKYLPWGTPSLGQEDTDLGVPLPWPGWGIYLGWGYLYWGTPILTWQGGTYLGWGGYLPWGIPSTSQGRYPPVQGRYPHPPAKVGTPHPPAKVGTPC